ncbi:MAG: hypothetical protein E1N59_1153 [Puniceicoccaceae bacterium 5H]|nr:MAG: hypothetical protein E1N59_1153 [Puniceicoccaceae bacterium 5H]
MRTLKPLLPLAAICAAVPVHADPLPLKAEPFPLSQVHLTEGPFKARQDVHLKYLLMVDADRLIAPFREQAGLKKKADRYGGWEGAGIAGHSLGHYLSALSLLYATTGDERLKERVDYIVDELAQCQQANGDGYLLPVDKQALAKLGEGEIDASGFSLNGVWVPLYNLHKVLAGLRDAYRHAGSEAALQVEKGMVDWMDGIFSRLDEDQIQEILRSEHGGMNEVLADLSVDTGNDHYLEMAIRDFNHQAVLQPMFEGKDELNGQHGNTQIPKVIGVAREYELTQRPEFHTAATSFWEDVAIDRAYVIGGHGDSEHFFPVDEFENHLTPYTAETCNTYNMEKLTGHLFSWEPQARLMDFAERGLINHIAANIGPEPGEFGYFLGLDSTGVKVFSSKFDSWWCCVGTGMENPARYPEQAYFHSPDGDTLWINLYMGSELEWPEQGLTLIQDTLFPNEERVRLELDLDSPRQLALKLRQPYWCEQPEISINGERVEVASEPTSYLTLEREWQDGDTVELRLPMRLHTEALPHTDGEILSVLYGPSVLAGIVPVQDGEKQPGGQRFGDHLKARGKTDAFPPVFVADDAQAVLDSLEPTGEAFAEFRSHGTVKPQDVRFEPLYRVYQEQYAVYFPLMDAQEWKVREAEMQAQRQAEMQLQAATVDYVTPGYQQPEVEHDLVSEDSRVEEKAGRKSRVASNGGAFSYAMEVAPDRPLSLVVTYWTGIWSSHTFDIYVDDQKIASPTIERGKIVGDFYDRTYDIPAALTKGKQHVRVRFASRENDQAGGVYGLRVVYTDATDTE